MSLPGIPPLNEVQKKLYDLLSTALSPVPVYDYVPEAAPTDYATVGEAFATPDNDHSVFRWQIVETIHVWSRTRGWKRPLDIAQDIAAALDHKRSQFDIPGFHCTSIRLEQVLTLHDPDPEIRHVPVQFRITMEQET